MKMKKRKPEPFVIYKAPPPRVKEEEDRGQYENMMFVKKKKPLEKSGKETQEESKALEKGERATVVKDEVKEEKGGSGEGGKLDKVPVFKNRMFGRAEPEPLEEDELVEEETGEVDISEEAKERIRKIGERRVEKQEGDLFKQHVVQQTEDGMRMDRWAGIHFPTLPHARLCKVLRSKLV